MKVVINKCYGGFSLSARGTARLAELKGRPCYFFTKDIRRGFDAPLKAVTVEEADAKDVYMFFAYDVPNPDEVLPPDPVGWSEWPIEKRRAHNATYEAHSIENRPRDRNDPDLVRVVEELGAAANGRHAELRVVEIPDGVEYEIDEYDGIETIHETHRSWA